MVILPSIRRKYMVSRIPKGATVSMSECVVTLATDSVQYNGQPRTVGVAVTWQGATLAVNTDYTLSFANNKNVGSATVTVTGMGQFSGSVTKNFSITSGAVVGWDGIDLANTTDTGNSAALSGISGIHHLQTLQDGRLFFIDATDHKMRIWGFDSGHPFEVSHFKSSADSVSDAVSNAQMGALTGNGLAVAYSQLSYGRFWTRPLSTAFDLSTLGTQTERQLAANNLRIHIARNGLHLAIKDKVGVDLSVYSLSTANDFSTLSQFSTKNMSNIVNGTWRDFVFSEDGLTMLAVVGGSVCRIDFETAWDVTTGSQHSSFTPTGLTGDIDAVAVSNDATKMILFSTGDGKFHEYNLSA